MNKLKAAKDDRDTPSLILAFTSEWEQPLTDNRVSAVFRRKGPVDRELGYLYAYVGAPVSALIGRAKVTAYQRMPVEAAFKLADKGKIKADVLREYARGKDELGVFRLGKFEPFSAPVSAEKLASAFGLVPPQNFVFISKQGKAALDKLAGA
jgi:predicted transcriptional regulator